MTACWRLLSVRSLYRDRAIDLIPRDPISPQSRLASEGDIQMIWDTTYGWLARTKETTMTDTTPHTRASMRDRKLTLLQMLDLAVSEQTDPRTLESLCAEAAKEIRELQDTIRDAIGEPIEPRKDTP